VSDVTITYDPQTRTTLVEIDGEVWAGPEPEGADGALRTCLALSALGYAVTLAGAPA
jgi:hypothetical protein